MTRAKLETTVRTPDGQRHTVRRSITPGWSYDVLTPCVHWRADEWGAHPH